MRDREERLVMGTERTGKTEKTGRAALVGYTGFVGSNIHASAGDQIGALYNSKNIKEAYGTSPDLLIYAGLRAEKYLANTAPEKDMDQILQAEENIERTRPKKLVLISTIDVFKNPKGVDETSEVDTEELHPYGYNRYQLELWVREHFPDALIIRLPGLFGKNIRKNFIYDFINVIPYMLKKEKLEELSVRDPELKKYYELQSNGFYRVRDMAEEEKKTLRDRFRVAGFTALNFTDSRSRYQFYNLERLWGDIQVCLENDIRLWHPATEPVSAREIYKYLTGNEFINEFESTPADYDYRTARTDIFIGENGYINNKNEVLQQIKEFVKGKES